MIIQLRFFINPCLFLLMAIACSPSGKSNIKGRWAGSCTADSITMSLWIDIIKPDSAVYNSDEQRALNIPLQNFQLRNDSIYFELQGDSESWLFKGIHKGKHISGQIIKGDRSAAFSLTKQGIKKQNYKATEITFKNDTVVLSGTLLLPESKEKLPAVVFMHGSGNEQRFASAYMADFLAQRGIAALIFDKRGTGKSTGNWINSSFEDLANDAFAGVKFLQQQPGINPQKIGIYGHSQGGSICPMALNMYPGISFGISAASAGVSMAESDWYEVQNRFRNYVSGNDYDNAMKVMQKYIEFASTGKGYDALIKEANKFKAEQWYQEHVGDIDTTGSFWKYYRKIGRYNPVDYWRNVRQPVLILKGERDQTSPGYPTFQNIENALKQANNANYKIIIFQNTTHEMHISGSNNDFFFKATPGYCDTIYNWIDHTIIK